VRLEVSASDVLEGMTRRRFMKACAGLLVGLPELARAQAYPSRPVRILVGFPPGGTTDVVARIIAQWLSTRFNSAFVVENKPGAGTNLATEVVVRAPPDGYTLLIVTPSNAINATLYDNLPFNFARDTAPIVRLIRSPYVLEVNPRVPVKTVPELITYVKENPGTLTIASFGTGTASHLSGEMFKMLTGTQMVHVPYRGSAPMLTDLLGGRVEVAFDNLPASVEYIRTGRLRALAVTTAERAASLPEIPTLAEALPGYETSSWLAVAAPAGTPADVITTLNREINAALADPAIRKQLADLGCTVLGGAPADAAALIMNETEKWSKVIRFAGIKQN
jgi:tripartite-type tricarboxylate transporter receptor subunit TctC